MALEFAVATVLFGPTLTEVGVFAVQLKLNTPLASTVADQLAALPAVALTLPGTVVVPATPLIEVVTSLLVTPG